MSTIPRNTEFNKDKLIAFIFIVFLVPMIVLLIWLYDHYLIAFLLIFIIYILVIVALITKIIRTISRRRKKKNRVRIERQIIRNYQEEVNENTRELIFDGRDQLTIRQETQLKEKLSIKLQSYSYKGIVENKICMITKNPFKQNDKIIQCPNCFSLYQEKYLIDWLIRKNICPVCGEKSFQIK